MAQNAVDAQLSLGAWVHRCAVVNYECLTLLVLGGVCRFSLPSYDQRNSRRRRVVCVFCHHAQVQARQSRCVQRCAAAA